MEAFFNIFLFSFILFGSVKKKSYICSVKQFLLNNI